MIMKQIVTFFKSNWTEHQVLTWIVNIMVAVHVGLGVAVLVGGPQRFSFPSYQPLIDMSNGHTWLWGVWVLAAAGIMMIPARWPQIIGLWLGMAWNVMWCSLFAVAVVEYPTAGATAAVAYGGFAMLDAALLTARIVERNGG